MSYWVSYQEMHISLVQGVVLNCICNSMKEIIQLHMQVTNKKNSIVVAYIIELTINTVCIHCIHVFVSIVKHDQ